MITAKVQAALTFELKVLQQQQQQHAGLTSKLQHKIVGIPNWVIYYTYDAMPVSILIAPDWSSDDE